jgi:hypothetical protein
MRSSAKAVEPPPRGGMAIDPVFSRPWAGPSGLTAFALLFQRLDLSMIPLVLICANPWPKLFHFAGRSQVDGKTGVRWFA